MVLKLKLTKNHFKKIFAPKFLFFIEKKIRKIQMIFDKKIQVESPILELHNEAAKLRTIIIGEDG